MDLHAEDDDGDREVRYFIVNGSLLSRNNN